MESESSTLCTWQWFTATPMPLRSQGYTKWLGQGIMWESFFPILSSGGKKSRLLRSLGTQDLSLVPCLIWSEFGALPAVIHPAGSENTKNSGCFLRFYTWCGRGAAVCPPGSRHSGWTFMTRCLFLSNPSLVFNHHLKTANMGNYKILSINYNIWKIYNTEHMLLMIFLLWKVSIIKFA